MDIIVLVDLILSIFIFGLGFQVYRRKKDNEPLFIGIAFLLFTITHLITLLGLAASLEVLLIIILIFAYLLVILALNRMVAKK